MDVYGIRTASDGIRKLPRLKHVVSGQRVLADDPSGLADADLGARADQMGLRKTRDVPFQET